VYPIEGTDLAKVMKVSNNAISHYRKATTMPQISGERLNDLLNALNALKSRDEPIIGIGDLMEYSPERQEPTDWSD
jgi:transcriptional regulator with XRE-family HTH domain